MIHLIKYLFSYHSLSVISGIIRSFSIMVLFLIVKSENSLSINVCEVDCSILFPFLLSLVLSQLIKFFHSFMPVFVRTVVS